MPTLLSLFNNNNTHNKEHGCACNCHEDNSTIIFTPTRWFPRIKRRSSSSSSTCTAVSYEDHSSRVSSDYTAVDMEENHILEFEKLYSLAVDEVK